MRDIVEKILDKLEELEIKNDLGVSMFGIKEGTAEQYKKDLDSCLEVNDDVTNQYTWAIIKEIAEVIENAVG